MKKLIGLILAAIIAITAIPVGASEAPHEPAEEKAEILWGDADADGSVTVLDATVIQKCLASLIPMLSDENLKAALVSGEEKLSIIDATLIQRYLASLIERFPIEEYETPTEEESVEMKMMINDIAVKIAWEENEAVSALKAAVRENPLTIRMSMYGGFEQVGALGMSLPRDDTRITTSPGDVVLYCGNQMVVFYGSNTWAYTRLGHITDKTQQELSALLCASDVTITLTL